MLRAKTLTYSRSGPVRLRSPQVGLGLDHIGHLRNKSRLETAPLPSDSIFKFFTSLASGNYWGRVRGEIIGAADLDAEGVVVVGEAAEFVAVEDADGAYCGEGSRRCWHGGF